MSGIDIKQLTYFHSVASVGSISQAAATLGIAQPAVTRQILNLERELGVKLFYRNGRGVMLTAAGEVLAVHAKVAIDSVRQAEHAVREVSGIASGKVVMAAPPTASQMIVGDVVRAIRSDFPMISLKVIEAFSGYVAQWLATGHIDVALLYTSMNVDNVTHETLLVEELYLVDAPRGRSASDTVEMADLVKRPLILPSRSHGLRVLVEQVSSAAGIDLSVDLEIDALSVIRSLVETGHGRTILPLALVQKEVSQGLLQAQKIVNPTVSRKLVLATSHHQPLTLATRSVIREIKSTAKALRDRL